MSSNRRIVKDSIMTLFLWSSAAFLVLIVLGIIVYIMINTMFTCLGLSIGCKKDKNKEHKNEQNYK